MDPGFISDDKLKDLAADTGIPDTRMFMDLVGELSARKRRMFPDDRRFILHTQVQLRPDGTFYLTAATASVEPG